MTNCLYCKALNEADVRKAFENQNPIHLERVDLIEPWHQITDTKWCATFFCDACGTRTDIVLELVNEPDPADWWKS